LLADASFSYESLHPVSPLKLHVAEKFEVGWMTFSDWIECKLLQVLMLVFELF